MRICASCGRPLSETDLCCPNCGEGVPYTGRSDLSARIAALYGLTPQNSSDTEQQRKKQSKAKRSVPNGKAHDPFSRTVYHAADDRSAASGEAAPASVAETVLPDTEPEQPMSEPVSSPFDALPTTSGPQPRTPDDDRLRTVYRAADDRSAASGEAAPAPEAETALPDTEPEQPMSEPVPLPPEADAESSDTAKALSALFSEITAMEPPAATDAESTPEKKHKEKKERRAHHEAELRDAEPEEGERLLRTGTVGRGGVIAILLASLAAVAAAIFLIVTPLLEQQKQEEESARLAYLQYLVGSWQSDSFVYADSANPAREILTLNSDYSFSSVSLMSPNDRDTYDPATWVECERLEGSYTIELESAALRFTYAKDGANYVYDRYIRELDTGALTLREYYNEKMTDYYDVVFRKTEG